VSSRRVAEVQLSAEMEAPVDDADDGNGATNRRRRERANE